MTVGKLIEVLNKCNPHSVVYGEWEGISPNVYAVTVDGDKVFLHVDQMYFNDSFVDRDVIYKAKG